MPIMEAIIVVAFCAVFAAGFLISAHKYNFGTLTTATETAVEEKQPPTISKWDHGFKTDYVTATRYSNPHGFNIGFRFPRHVHNYDSPELLDWFKKYDGVAVQFGGAPGAEVLVIFKGVTDKESANKKLAVVVPALTEFMKTIRTTS